MVPPKRNLLLQIFFLTFNAYLTIAQSNCDGTSLPVGCVCNTAISHTNAVRCTGLDAFPTDIPDGTEYILFHTCRFMKIGGANVPNYSGITILQITNSEVTTIENDAFGSLSLTLKTLDLSGNAIANLSRNVFIDMPVLEQLDLNRNRLSSLSSDVFSFLHNLKQLHLEENQIASLPEDIFKNNPKLTEIDLADNQLVEIPSAVKKLSNLTDLDLTSNAIGDLKANSFKNLTSLQYLDLRYCNIGNIDDGAFNGLANVRFLGLDYNHLERLSGNALEPMQLALRRIWLNNNKLTTLEEGTLPTGGVLTELKLGGNPWHCDANIAWMKDLQLEKIDHENVTCKTPAHFEGYPIGNITKAMLQKEDNGMRSMIAAAIALPIIAVCIVIIFLIVYKLVQSRRLQKRASFRYSAVYRDTVESAYPPAKHRPTSEI